MEKNLPIHLQEIIFSSSDKSLSKQISKLEKTGQIRKIAPSALTCKFLSVFNSVKSPINRLA
ncbi:MAG: hypothetical protein K0B10_15835 [Vicingaceae bacterium]|nr:hypothetical protein [Vicingaceae bacterium]